MTAAEIAADRIAVAGLAAGEALWEVVGHAIDAGLSGRKARSVFDVLVEQLTEDMPETEAALFAASAFEALPNSATSTADRAKINANAWRAYEVFVGDAREAEADARADYYRDQRRDERMMAGVK